MDIKISVRSLVEFILRSGDITEGGNTLPIEAMNAGSRIHRKIQKNAGAYYDPEVPLDIMVPGEQANVLISGRADGIIYGEYVDGSMDTSDIKEIPVVIIDEIKGVYKKIEDINEPVPVHLAQAMCYAYIYADKYSLENINVRMTYVNLETEEIKYLTESYNFSQLSVWFHNVVDQLIEWINMYMEHKKSRNMSLKDMEFPYEYREGQRDMAACVYSSIKRENHLFVQAPTGIGKTMAALYPTVKSMEQGLTSKIFYLTAKTIAKTVAGNAINILMDKGAKIISVQLTAKEKICPLPEMECNPEVCPYAKGHYDRINETVYEMVSKEDYIDREVILSYALKHNVCPFELGLDASLFADIVVGDYNYVFDPRVNLKRFFASGERNNDKYVFLVDEAHNLVDRASSMYSAEIYKEDLLSVKKIVKKYSGKIARYFDRCNKDMLEMKKECMDKDYQVLEDIGNLQFKLLNLYSALETFLEDYKNIPERKEVLDFYFSINSFLNISELVNDSYRIYDEILPDGRFMIKLYCVQPAENLRLCLDKGVATIFFSATLLPIKYYMEMLSNCEKDYAIYIPSPFDKKKREILVGTDVATRYTKRGQQEYEKIADYIENMVKSHKGNYMVFFSSYKMLNDIYQVLETRKLDSYVNLSLQSPSMTEIEREDFLQRFDKEDNLLALCIMGGIFSEGIDLIKEKLVGTAVVGPGLPQISMERSIMMDYFGTNGFKYAYIYPGINKVFQAAGRVIRTEEDKGIILLLDERFKDREYSELFPLEWEDYKLVDRKEARKIMDEFWSKA